MLLGYNNTSLDIIIVQTVLYSGDLNKTKSEYKTLLWNVVHKNIHTCMFVLFCRRVHVCVRVCVCVSWKTTAAVIYPELQEWGSEEEESGRRQEEGGGQGAEHWKEKARESLFLFLNSQDEFSPNPRRHNEAVWILLMSYVPFPPPPSPPSPPYTLNPSPWHTC